MKKNIAVLLTLTMVFAFAACGAKEETPNGDQTGDTQQEQTATEMTLEDIDNAPFPTGYTYETTRDGEVVDSGEYTFPEGMDHSVIVRAGATVSERTVVESGIQDDMIYTDCEYKLQDGTRVQVLFVNDPETKNFVAANEINEDETTVYTYIY